MEAHDMPKSLLKKTEFKNSPEVEKAVRLHQDGWELVRKGKEMPSENKVYQMAIFVQKIDGTWGTVRGQTDTHFVVLDIIPHEQIQHIAYKDKVDRESRPMG